LTRKERWILSEWRVAKDRVERCNEELLGHQIRNYFAEIDLIFQSRDEPLRGLTIVEVKSWSGEIWKGELLSARQAFRLERSREALEAKSGRPVRLLLAVVGRETWEIRYFPFPL
jgi:Holliday junction resolvase-like predicted endonuclease